MSHPSRADAQARRNKALIRHRFHPSRFLGDPFAISSTSIALISWTIAIGGSIAAATTSGSFPRFTWWGIAYQFAVICFIVVIYCFDCVDLYKGFLSNVTAIAFIYSTNSATNLVYSGEPQKAAASAGVILLSIVNIIWVFYFGSDNASPSSRYIDSFALTGLRPSAHEDAVIRFIRRHSNSTSGRTSKLVQPSNMGLDFGNRNSVLPHQYVSSAELTGFENTRPVFDGPVPSPSQRPHSQALTSTTNGDTMDIFSDIDEDVFRYKARALYAYKADEADGYEISFEQGEELQVSDIEGRWWRARRANGEVGIIPSNYVQLIETHGVSTQ